MQEAVRSDELQIGNYVLNRKNQIVEITVDDLKLLSIWEANPYTKNPPFRPIEITVEILMQFGFNKRANATSNSWYIGENQLTHDWLFDLVWLNQPELIGAPNFPFYRNGRFVLKRVHTLQNLYSSLTGEKLKFIV